MSYPGMVLTQETLDYIQNQQNTSNGTTNRFDWGGFAGDVIAITPDLLGVITGNHAPAGNTIIYNSEKEDETETNYLPWVAGGLVFIVVLIVLFVYLKK